MKSQETDDQCCFPYWWSLFSHAGLFLLVLTFSLPILGLQPKCPQQNRTENISSDIFGNVSRNGSVLNITMAFLTNVAQNGTGKKFGGAFFLALNQLNEEAQEKGIQVNFSYTFIDTRNREVDAMKGMADLYCAGYVSAFIGPDGYCKPAGLMATAYHIPYLTFACHDNHNDTAAHLMVNRENYLIYVSKYIVYLLQYYKWTSVWLLAGTDIKWQSTKKLFKTRAEKTNISVTGDNDLPANDRLVPQHYTYKSPYSDVLQNTREKTRVYVFLGEYESLLMFLKEMKDTGLTDSGKYVVVAGEDGTQKYSYPNYFITTFDKNDKEHETAKEYNNFQEKEKQALAAMRNILVVTPTRHQRNSTFEKRVYERNHQEPINLLRYPGKNEPTIPNVPMEAYELYDATMFYGRAVMDLMIKYPLANPLNGTQIINHLRCKSHASILGHQVYIHANGESEGSFEVYGMVLNSSSSSSRPSMVQVGTFALNTNQTSYEYIPGLEPLWVNGVPDGVVDEDADKSLADWEIAIIVAAIVILVLIVVVILFVSIRHYMYEQKLERLAWKIERDDIQLLNPGQFQDLMSPQKPKKKDSYNGGNQLRTFLLADEPDPDIISNSTNQSQVIPVGVYRGTNVVVKQLSRKHLELTRALKKQLQLRKELTHDNINRFIGACIETPHVFIVTQFCTRKSLQDILSNEASPLDDMFVTSLVQDLIRGMTFIHESDFGYHGNLKSSNCLVDSRWTLKISDFGLSALGSPPQALFEDEETFRAMLWMAPELLRQRRSSNHSSQHHQYSSYSSSSSSSHQYNRKSQHQVIYAGQKGDVYSFSVILYELYGKAGPWGQVKMTNREIIERLTNQMEPVFRPETSSLTCNANIISLIRSCWDNDPYFRPDFKYGIRSLFKPIQQELLRSNIFDNMLAMMEKYANNLENLVAERTEQLRQEKRMTENLLLRMLPRSVAERLKRGQQVEPEQYEQVSIYFSDIVGFTELSAESTPMEVVDLLNDLYTCFDSIIEEFDVYKVETIGDAYMVVSGLPMRNGDRHAGEIASMSLLLLEAIKQRRFGIRGIKDNMLKIRIGIHSGPCCAGVVGLKMPRYCLFGDTVNTASRLESTGEALKIHCSTEVKKILDKLGGYHLEERGYTEMKGKGCLLTYFLVSEDQRYRYRRISRYKKMGNDDRCVSTSNLDYSGKIYSLARKGMTHLPTGKGNHQVKDSFISDRHSWTSSLNTSQDSSWSEVPEELQANVTCQQNQTAALPEAHQFAASTLPRASVPKYNTAYMSPIAEDPSLSGDSFPLEKTISFPNTILHDTHITEAEALLGDGLGLPYIQLTNIPKRKNMISRSVSCQGRSPNMNGYGMRIGNWRRDSDSFVTYHDSSRSGGSPETVL